MRTHVAELCEGHVSTRDADTTWYDGVRAREDGINVGEQGWEATDQGTEHEHHRQGAATAAAGSMTYQVPGTSTRYSFTSSIVRVRYSCNNYGPFV